MDFSLAFLLVLFFGGTLEVLAVTGSLLLSGIEFGKLSDGAVEAAAAPAIMNKIRDYKVRHVQ